MTTTEGRVVRAPLEVALRKRQRVLDVLGREGEVVGFHRQRSWAFRRPQMVSYVIVEYGDGRAKSRRYLAAAELRVIERTEGSQHVA